MVEHVLGKNVVAGPIPAPGSDFFQLSSITQNSYYPRMRILPTIRHAIYTLTIIGIVFLTGFAAICYQVILERIMKLVVGGTITTSFIMTYATLIGMGVGALLAVLPSIKNKISFYTLVCVNGVYTVASALCILPILQHFANLLVVFSVDPTSSSAILNIIAVVLLLPAAIISGATIPKIIQFSLYNSSLTAGTLYGIYTMGSAIGIYMLIRVFLPLYNFNTNFFIIAIIYFVVTGMLYAINRPLKNSAHNASIHRAIPINRTLAFIQFISSAMIIILEVSIFRSISVAWGSDSAYTYPFALMTYLIAYAIGNIFLASFYRKFLKTIGLLPLLLLLPIAFMISLYLPKTIPNQGLLSLFFIGGFEHTGLIALIAGAIFPLILYMQPSDILDRQSGVFSFISSLGTFAGGLFFISIGLPYLGTQKSILIAFFVYIGVITCLLARGRTRIFYGMIVGVLCTLYAYIPVTIWDIWILHNTSQYTQSIEGSGGVALIQWNDISHSRGSVIINGTPAAYLPYLRDHTILAALASGAPNRSNVLLLGLGGGGLTRDILGMRGVKTVDVVEWSREVVTLLRATEANKLLENALYDPRVTIYPTDARTYVTTAIGQNKKYSLIVDNLTVIGWSGSSTLRSIEYFQSMMPLLTDDGVYIIFMHHNTNAQYDSALAGLSRTCPYVTSYDKTYIICATHEIPWDVEYMDSMLKRYSAQPELHQMLNPLPRWLFNKYTHIDPATYSRIKPIHEMQPYFEYEPFSIQKK